MNKGMNDKQKELALEMAVASASLLLERNGSPRVQEAYLQIVAELRSAYDLAADPPKRKLTAADIQKPKKDESGPWWRITCREFGWCNHGWDLGYGHGYTESNANVIYAGLVATATLPPEDAQ